MRTPKRHIQPLLYSVTEVARLIGFGRTATYEMIRLGTIPSIVVAGRTRVRREVLAAWIESEAKQNAR
jgi:excisionase family DNA binding protein